MAEWFPSLSTLMEFGLTEEPNNEHTDEVKSKTEKFHLDAHSRKFSYSMLERSPMNIMFDTEESKFGNGGFGRIYRHDLVGDDGFGPMYKYDLYSLLNHSTIALQKSGDENYYRDGKMTSQLEEKRKETVQRVSSFVTAIIMFLHIMSDAYDLYYIQPLPLLKQNDPIFKWSSLLDPISFMVFAFAILTTIAVGGTFSRFQSATLMSWANWTLIGSASSINVTCVILGTLLTGWYILMIKQPPRAEKLFFDVQQQQQNLNFRPCSTYLDPPPLGHHSRLPHEGK